MLIKEVMKAKVVTVTASTSVKHAARLMLDNHISGLPVIDDEGGLVGIVTEGDMLRRHELDIGLIARDDQAVGAEERAAAYIKRHGWSVGNLMSRPPVTISEEASIGRAAALMVEKGVKRLPVMRDGHLVGIVSRRDLLCAFAKLSPDMTASGDEAIRRSITTRLCEDIGFAQEQIAVTVNGGIVHLWGVARSNTEREAARVATETVRGVSGVENHIRVEPLQSSDGQ
jgi:CBS domain-containing protein